MITSIVYSHTRDVKVLSVFPFCAVNLDKYGFKWFWVFGIMIRDIGFVNRGDKSEWSSWVVQTVPSISFPLVQIRASFVMRHLYSTQNPSLMWTGCILGICYFLAIWKDVEKWFCCRINLVCIIMLYLGWSRHVTKHCNKAKHRLITIDLLQRWSNIVSNIVVTYICINMFQSEMIVLSY